MVEKFPKKDGLEGEDLVRKMQREEKERRKKQGKNKKNRQNTRDKKRGFGGGSLEDFADAEFSPENISKAPEEGVDETREENNDERVDPKLIFKKLNELRRLNRAEEDWPDEDIEIYIHDGSATKQHLNLLEKLISKHPSKKDETSDSPKKFAIEGMAISKDDEQIDEKINRDLIWHLELMEWNTKYGFKDAAILAFEGLASLGIRSFPMQIHRRIKNALEELNKPDYYWEEKLAKSDFQELMEEILKGKELTEEKPPVGDPSSEDIEINNPEGNMESSSITEDTPFREYSDHENAPDIREYAKSVLKENGVSIDTEEMKEVADALLNMCILISKGIRSDENYTAYRDEMDRLNSICPTRTERNIDLQEVLLNINAKITRNGHLYSMSMYVDDIRKIKDEIAKMPKIILHRPNMNQDDLDTPTYLRKNSNREDTTGNSPDNAQRKPEDCCEELREKLSELEHGQREILDRLERTEINPLATKNMEIGNSSETKKETEVSCISKAFRWIQNKYLKASPLTKSIITSGLVLGGSLAFTPLSLMPMLTTAGLGAKLVTIGGGITGALVARGVTGYSINKFSEKRLGGKKLEEVIADNLKRYQDAKKPLLKEYEEAYRKNEQEKLNKINEKLQNLENKLVDDNRGLIWRDLLKRAMAIGGGMLGGAVAYGHFFGGPDAGVATGGVNSDTSYAVNAEAEATHSTRLEAETTTIANEPITEYQYFEFDVQKGDGAIETFRKFQESLIDTYSNSTAKMPPAVEHIINTSPEDLAKEYGFWKPEVDINNPYGKESAELLVKDNFAIDKQGRLIYNRFGGGSTILSDGSGLKIGSYVNDMFNYNPEAPQSNGSFDASPAFGPDGSPVAKGSIEATPVPTPVDGGYDTSNVSGSIDASPADTTVSGTTPEKFDALVNQDMQNSLNQIFPEKGFWIFKTPGGIDSPAWQELSKMTLGEFNSIQSPVSSLDRVNDAWGHKASWEQMRELRDYLSSSMPNYKTDVINNSGKKIEDLVRGISNFKVKNY